MKHTYHVDAYRENQPEISAYFPTAKEAFDFIEKITSKGLCVQVWISV